jgi:hypothetical protein
VIAAEKFANATQGLGSLGPSMSALCPKRYLTSVPPNWVGGRAPQLSGLGPIDRWDFRLLCPDDGSTEWASWKHLAIDGTGG